MSLKARLYKFLIDMDRIKLSPYNGVKMVF